MRVWPLVLLTACGDVTFEIDLEALPQSDARIVAFELGRAQPDALELPVVAVLPDQLAEAQSHFSRVLGEESAALRITAFHYARDFEQLGIHSVELKPVDQDPDAVGLERRLLDDHPTIRQTMTFRDSEAPTEWEPVEMPSAALQRFTYRSQICAELGATTISLEDKVREPSFAAPLVGPERRVLVGLSIDTNGSPAPDTPTLFVIGEDPDTGEPTKAPAVLVDCPSTEPPSEGGFSPPGSDRLFLGGAAGELWELSVEPSALRCVRTASSSWVATSSTGGWHQLHWMAGEAKGSKVDLYTLGIQGAFEHFDGTSFELIAELASLRDRTSVPPVDFDFHGGVAYVPGRGALAANVRGSKIVAQLDGVTAEVVVQEREGWSGLTYVDGLGVVGITAREASVYLLPDTDDEPLSLSSFRDPGSWVNLVQREMRDEGFSNAAVVAPFSAAGLGSFVTGATQGVMAHWAPRGDFDVTGFCKKEEVAAGSIRFIAPFGDLDLVTAGPSPQPQETSPAIVSVVRWCNSGDDRPVGDACRR